MITHKIKNSYLDLILSGEKTSEVRKFDIAKHNLKNYKGKKLKLITKYKGITSDFKHSYYRQEVTFQITTITINQLEDLSIDVLAKAICCDVSEVNDVIDEIGLSNTEPVIIFGLMNTAIECDIYQITKEEYDRL